MSMDRYIELTLPAFLHSLATEVGKGLLIPNGIFSVLEISLKNRGGFLVLEANALLIQDIVEGSAILSAWKLVLAYDARNR